MYISIIHFCISCVTDSIIFHGLKDDLTPYIYLKPFFFLILFVFWHNIYFFIRNKFLIGIYKCRFFLIALILNLSYVIISWPGAWLHDDIGLAVDSTNIVFDYWQNYLTSIYYIYSMMLIPLVGGVTIVQNILISSIIGYTVYKVDKYFIKSHYSYLLLLILLFPPVIFQNLYTLRLSLYSYLELLFLVISFLFLTKKEVVSNSKLVYFVLLIAILSVWRTEGIIYLIFGSIVLIKISYSYNFVYKFFLIISCLTFTGLLILPQINHKTCSGENGNYEETAYSNALPGLVCKCVENNDEEHLSKLTVICDVSKICNEYKNGKSGGELYWENKLFKKEYSKSDFNEFRICFFSLVLKYPDIFLKAQFENFKRASGLVKNKSNIINDPLHIFNGSFSWWASSYFLSNKAVYPLSINVRKNFFSLICCRNLSDFSLTNPYYPFVWNLFVPLLFILLSIVYFLFIKIKVLSFLISMTLVKSFFVFLTAPDAIFIYYFILYLLGYSLFLLGVVFLLKKYNLKSD